MNDQTNDAAEQVRAEDVQIEIPPSRALAPKERLTAGAHVAAIIPRTFEDVQRIANVSVRSGLLSRDLSSLERATVAIMFGAEIGLKPMASLQRIAVINGRPCVWGDAVPAIAFDTGEVVEFEEYIEGDGDQMTAYCKVARKLKNGAVIRKVGRFSVAQAKKAKLWDEREIVTRKGRDGSSYQKENDSPWFRFPERMLTMRARVALRDLFSDALCGLYIAEELVDRDSPAEMRDVTPRYERIDNPLGGNGEEVPDKVIDRAEAQDAPAEAVDAPGTESRGQQPANGNSHHEPPGEAGGGTKRKRTRPDGGAAAEGRQGPGLPGNDTVSGASAPPRPSDEFPQPYNRQSATIYFNYAKAWISAAPDHATARTRWTAERTIRNNLANPLNEDQLNELQAAMGRVGQ